MVAPETEGADDARFSAPSLDVSPALTDAPQASCISTPKSPKDPASTWVKAGPVSSVPLASIAPAGDASIPALAFFLTIAFVAELASGASAKEASRISPDEMFGPIDTAPPSLPAPAAADKICAPKSCPATRDFAATARNGSGMASERLAWPGLEICGDVALLVPASESSCNGFERIEAVGAISAAASKAPLPDPASNRNV
jgi:hypothetical protein